MRKGVALIVVILLMALPAASAVTTSTPIANKEITLEKTTTIMCNIGGKTISKELPTSVIEGIINMGKAHEKDFLTIYDKTKSPDDVAVAFRNVQPFFQALVDNGLTDRSVREIERSLPHHQRKDTRAETTKRDTEGWPTASRTLERCPNTYLGECLMWDIRSRTMCWFCVRHTYVNPDHRC